MHSTESASTPKPIGRPRRGMAFRAVWSAAVFRAARVRKGYTLDGFRAAMEIHTGKPAPPANTISAAWNQDGTPGPNDLETVRAVAEVLGIEPDDLYRPFPGAPSEWDPVALPDPD